MMNVATCPTKMTPSLTVHSGIHCIMCLWMSLCCNPIKIPGWTGPHELKALKLFPDVLTN